MSSCVRCEQTLGAADRADVHPLCQSPPSDYCAVCQDLVSVNDEIERVKATLDGLLEKQDKFRSRLNIAHPSIVDRLPVELTTQIFTAYASDTQYWLAPPLRLGAICQRWRMIAWSTPSLWLDIAFYFRRSLMPRTHLELVEEWLSRTEGHPLTIRLLGYNLSDSTPDLDQLHPLIDILNRHCAQWHRLIIRLPPSLLVRLGGSDCVSRRLDLITATATSEKDLTLPLFSQVAPERFQSFGPLSDTINFDWSRMTDVNVLRLTVDQIFHIFRQSRNLLKCSFDVVNIRDVSTPAVAYRHVNHPCLKSLRVRMSSEEAMDLFLNNVTFPNLRDLRIRDWASHPNPADLLHSLLVRSATELKTMRLETLNITAEELISLTQITRSLETLRFYPRRDAGDGHVEAFYQALQAHLPSSGSSGPNSRQVPLLPLLRSFEWKGYAAFPWDCVLAFLVPLSADGEVSRRPLERIEIVCRGFIDDPEVRLSDNIISQLSPFQDEVEFHLKVRDDPGDELDLWYMTRDYYRGNLGEGGSDTY